MEGAAIAPHTSKSNCFLNACLPTACALPLKMGLRHVPVGNSVIKLPQLRSLAKEGNVRGAMSALWLFTSQIDIRSNVGDREYGRWWAL
jgi:hypothetical protein